MPATALSSWHAISELRHNLSGPQRLPTAIPWGAGQTVFVNLTTPDVGMVVDDQAVIPGDLYGFGAEPDVAHDMSSR